jgi:hypothetical protein
LKPIFVVGRCKCDRNEETKRDYRICCIHDLKSSATLAMVFRDKAVPFVLKSAKDVPDNIITKRLEATKVTAYGLKKAA